MKKILDLGKIDYSGTGRKVNKVEIEIELEDGQLSICGDIWDSKQSDAYSGVQNIAEIASLFPHDEKVQRIKEVWERWHLNDLRAGSPNQEEYLRSNPIQCKYPESHYEKASESLKEAGLNPDPNYLYNGKPYEYGTAWLKEKLPAKIINEVYSW